MRVDVRVGRRQGCSPGQSGENMSADGNIRYCTGQPTLDWTSQLGQTFPQRARFLRPKRTWGAGGKWCPGSAPMAGYCVSMEGTPLVPARGHDRDVVTRPLAFQ